MIETIVSSASSLLDGVLLRFSFEYSSIRTVAVDALDCRNSTSGFDTNKWECIEASISQ